MARNEDKLIPMGVSLFERQVPELERLEREQGSPGRSAILRQIVDEYLRERPVLRLIEARRRRLITHEEAVDKFAVLVERDGSEEE